MFTETTTTWVLLIASCLTGFATAADVSTVRLMSDDGKPEKIVASAFSPDGRLFVVSVPARGITRSGYVAIIDLEGRRLVKQLDTMSFSALAFDNDSRHVLGVGGLAGVQQVDIESGKSRRMGKSPIVVISSAPPETRVAIDWTESKGSLFVRSSRDKAIADQVVVGDQLVAFNEGEKAIRHDASGEWRVLKPYGSKYVLKELDGLANSWLQLRFTRKGKEDPIEITVQRKPSSRQSNPLPKRRIGIAAVELRRSVAFYSSGTGRVCASLTPRDAEMEGFHAISPDCKLCGWISRLKGSRKEACVEVFSLATGSIVASGVIQSRDYKGIQFAPDSKTLLIGTRNTIEVFDIADQEWRSTISLVAPEERDEGRMVKRDAPVGLRSRGLEPRITAYFREYSKPAALCSFDVSASGLIAIGSESGELIVTKLTNPSVRRALGEKILKSKPEFVAFDPTGRHCVAYAGGEMFIFTVPTSGELSFESPQHAGDRQSIVRP